MEVDVIPVFSWVTMGPVSSPRSAWISVTPVLVTPSKICCGRGEGPRYLGSSDG